MNVELINNSWEQTQVYILDSMNKKLSDNLEDQVNILEDINNQIKNLETVINIDFKPNNNITIEPHKTIKTTNVYVNNKVICGASKINRHMVRKETTTTICHPPISNSVKNPYGISILGLNKPFYIKGFSLVDDNNIDLSHYLPIIFNYEPPGEDLILIGIFGYIVKENSTYLIYETKNKKTGVKKLFEAGTGLWWKWNKKIKVII